VPVLLCKRTAAAMYIFLNSSLTLNLYSVFLTIITRYQVTRCCSVKWVIISMSAFFSHEYRGYSDVSRHSNLRAVNPRAVARNLQASCGVNESFTVIAPKQPCLEGCYHSTNTSYQGLTTFTPSGDYYGCPQSLVRLGEHSLGNGSSEVGDGSILGLPTQMFS